MGKRLTAEDKLEVLKLLKAGNTSEQCAEQMGVSAPTINNLRAQFKKEGETFPNNRGRKKLSKSRTLKSETSKRLTAEDKLEVLKLLKTGNTSEQCAERMGVSAPTITNLRAQFKKEGESFPNNRGRKKLSKDKTSHLVKNLPQETKPSTSADYDYLINGIQIKFTQKPKTIRIGKNRFFVEFD